MIDYYLVMKKVRKAVSRFFLQDLLPIESKPDQDQTPSLLPIADSFYFDHENYWEPNVVLACRDILNPGDVFWDIGANMGGVTRLASRLVGPNGKVIAVEASLPNFRKLNNNVVVNHLSNVFLVRAAIWNSLGHTLTLFNGDGGNDSLFANERLLTNSEKVLSLTLDDLFRMYGMPNLIKMDIEGAEYEALMGAEQILLQSPSLIRPIFILESSSKDKRALNFLLQKGYILQDLATGTTWADFETNHPDPISNWLAIPKERESLYLALLTQFSESHSVPQRIDSKFVFNSLQRGRYRIDISIHPIVGESVFINVYCNEILISRYHGDAAWLQDSYKSRQLDCRENGALTIAIVDPAGLIVPSSSLVDVKLYIKDYFEINMSSYIIAP